MSIEQAANEVAYKITVKFLDILLRDGVITPAEYQKIDDLDRQTFTPELSEVYAK